MTPGIGKAEAMRRADEMLSKLIAGKLSEAWAQIEAAEAATAGDGNEGPPPGGRVQWTKVTAKEIVAAEGLRLSAWKQAELAKLSRWLDAEFPGIAP